MCTSELSPSHEAIHHATVSRNMHHYMYLVNTIIIMRWNAGFRYRFLSVFKKRGSKKFP